MKGRHRIFVAVLMIILTFPPGLVGQIYGHYDKPGPPPIANKVTLDRLDLLTQQDDWGYTELRVLLKLEYVDHEQYVLLIPDTNYFSFNMDETGTPTSVVRGQTGDKIDLVHLECSPESQTNVEINLTEVDGSTSLRVVFDVVGGILGGAVSTPIAVAAGIPTGGVAGVAVVAGGATIGVGLSELAQSLVGMGDDDLGTTNADNLPLDTPVTIGTPNYRATFIHSIEQMEDTGQCNQQTSMRHTTPLFPLDQEEASVVFDRFREAVSQIPDLIEQTVHESQRPESDDVEQGELEEIDTRQIALLAEKIVMLNVENQMQDALNLAKSLDVNQTKIKNVEQTFLSASKLADEGNINAALDEFENGYSILIDELKPAVFDPWVTNVEGENTIQAGENASITVNVTNYGGSEGIVSIPIWNGGQFHGIENSKIGPFESKNVKVTVPELSTGKNTLSVNGFTSIVTVEEKQKLPPPLKQHKNGVAPIDVLCEEGKTLVIKVSKNTPACVYPNTANVLIEREWGSLP